MTLSLFKLVTATIIWLITLLVALKPLHACVTTARHHSHATAEAFASGIFLGAGLFHMLPDANKGFHLIYANTVFPFANVLCALGFVLLLFVEKYLLKYARVHEVQKPNILPIALTIILSTHALIEGAALGINNTLATTGIIFIAIIAHKGTESYALATLLVKSLLPAKKVIWLFMFFSIVTPLGIAFGSGLGDLFSNRTETLLAAIFNAIAAGSFLYIATLHNIPNKQSIQGENHLMEFLNVILGLTVMAVLAIWV
jgi:zinc transporter ZupT